jgi:hypothetical protein
VATIDESIAILTARLTALDDKIAKQEAFQVLEEGSASSRFRTEFTPIHKLYEEREKVATRLTTLQIGQLI